jgi:hypothetical protein
MTIKTHLTKRLIATVAIVLAFSTIGVSTAGAWDVHGGRAPATTNDAWMECGIGEVTFMLPADSPGRYSLFGWTLDGGDFQYDNVWY